MSGNWYCLIFGEELGPMSWDDLLAMVARGTLGKRERVKQGVDAEWLIAEAVDGLFSASAATDVDDADFDVTPSAPKPETLSPSADDDFDLGPSVKATPSDEADFDVAEQPPAQPRPAPSPADDDFDLGPSVKATRSDEADFDVAEQPPAATKSAPSGDGEFEVAAPPVHALIDDADFEVTPAASKSGTIAPSGDDDFDLSASLKPASAENAGVEVVGQSSAQVEATQPLSSDQANATPVPPREDLSGRETPPREEKPRKKSGGGLSASSRRALVFLGGGLGALAVAYLAYLGIVALAAMRRPNYDEILAGYDQLFQQAQAARSDAAAVGNPRATMEFLARLKTLRGGLRNTDADSADAQLSEAGSLLAQLYATAQSAPNSREGQERGAVESEYLAKISAVRSKLAK